MVNFCQHSEYSFLGSLLRLKDLVHFNAFQGYSACSLTDTLSTFGYYSLTELCRKKNIKPIYGITLFTNGVSGKGCYPIVLIANNNIGLTNIFKLNSMAHQKFEKELSYKLNLKDLAKYKEGITFMAEAELISHYDNYSYLTQYFEKMKDLFSHQFYISINYTGHAKVDMIKQILVLIKHYDIPGTANIESRYHHPDTKVFQYLNAYRQKTFKDDERGTILDTEMDYSIRSSQEFNHLFSNHKDILSNNQKILDNIDTHLDLDHFLFQTSHQSLQKLKRICEIKLMELEKHTDSYINLLQQELDRIHSFKLEDIYLILNELSEYIIKEHIPLSPGFGINIASLIFYLLGQHVIDPLKHPLLTHTELNEYPHFTIDAGWKEKQKVIDHIVDHFGNSQLAHTASITHILGRTAIRNMAQVYPLTKDAVNQLLKFFPSFQTGTEKYIKPHLQKSLALQNHIKNNPDILEFLEICSRIEGLPSYASAHSDTVMIIPQGVEKYATLEYYQDSRFMAQIRKEDVEHNTVLSIDIRGKRFTSVLYQLSRIIAFKDIDLKDHLVWSNIAKWSHHSISFMESSVFKSLLRKTIPSDIESFAHVFALLHNLQLKNTDKVDHYIKRLLEKEAFDIPIYLTPALKETCGILLYEEQLRTLFKKMKAVPEKFVKDFFQALRNKDDESIPSLRQDLIQACSNEDIKDDLIQYIVSLIFDEASSLFPYYQALSQSYQSYYAVYFWTHHKREYYLHLLNNAIGYPVRINDLIAECRTQDIQIMGLDINKSNVYFTPEKNYIRTGLIVVKYLNSTICQNIVNIRRSRSFDNLVDFLIRTKESPLSTRQIQNLIKSGSFRFDHPPIADLLQNYPNIQQWIRDNNIIDEAKLDEFGLFTNNPTIKLPPTTDFIKVSTENDSYEISDMELIQESTDLFLDKHPVHKYYLDLQKMDIDNLSHLPELNYAVCAIYLYKLRVVKTKNDKDMAFASISDPSGLAEAVFFPLKYKKYIHVIKEKELYLIKGKVDENKILVDEIYLLDVVL